MSLVSLIHLVLLLASGALVFPLTFNHGYGKSIRFLFLNIILAIILEFCTSVLFSNLPNNLLFYHIADPLGFVLYSLFFYELLVGKLIKKCILILIPVYVVVSIYLSLFIQKSDTNNGYALILESVTIIVYSLLYLRHINLYQIEQRAELNPFFWIIVGILINFTGTFFIEGFLNLLTVIDNDKARFYYKIGYVCKYLMYIMIGIGSIVISNQPKSSNT